MSRNGNLNDIERCAPDFFAAGMDRLIDDIEHHRRQPQRFTEPSPTDVALIDWHECHGRADQFDNTL